MRDIVQGAAGLHIVGKAIDAISNAITSLPREAFNFSKNLEASQVGMAGILGSMTAINGRQTDYNRALQISSQYIRQLNDDALRTAATSQELVTVFQALLAPGLGAKMTLDEIRQLTVVGTNAVKSMGLESTQVVQELRDLVAGGIQPASSTFATALGLKDTDIAKAKASSEGLFKFLMDRMQGFEASSNAFGDTFRGKLEQVREGATRVAAEGMEPLITASKTALGEISKLFLSIDENKNVTLNQDLIASIKAVSQAAVDGVSMLYEHRDAVAALAAVYASVKLGSFVAELAAATAVRMEAVQASRLAAAQAAAESAANVEVVATSRQKVAAYLAELQAQVAQAQADAAAQAAQIALLATTREAIVLARTEVLAKLDAVRATMAQAEAQIAAARAAGAQSIALALVREGTQALTAAQARHALLMTELATLGKQQASVQAAVAAATSAQTAATTAATASAARLAAAQGAASIAGRALSGAVGFLGGPIGIVTTALTLGATAWAVWGNKGNRVYKDVTETITHSTYAASEYAREGEQAIDTLQRLGTSIINVNGAFETLNLALLDASLAGADAASRFVDLFGGLDQFNTAAATYYQNFYSDSERLAKSREAVDKQLKDLGVDIDLSAPDARAKFRAEVERQQARMVQEEKNRAATGSALGTLASSGEGLSLADMSTSSILDAIGFDPNTSATLSQAQQDQLRSTFSALDAGKISAAAAAVSINDLIAPLDGTGKSAEETVAGLLQASGAFAQVTESSQDAAAAITRAQDEAWAVLQKSVQAAKDAAQAEIALRKERVDAARALVELTREQVRELRGQVDATAAMQVAEANAYIDRALTTARTTGYLPETDGLRQAIDTARSGMGTGEYTSRQDWEAAQLILANKLEAIGDVGDKQLSTDELLLEQAQKEVDRLDAIIKAGREALDAARGTTVAVKDVETAVREFYARLFPETDGAAAGSGAASSSGGDGWSFGGSSAPAAKTGPGVKSADGKYMREQYMGAGYGSSYQSVSNAEQTRLDNLASGLVAEYTGTGDVAGLFKAAKEQGYTLSDLATVGGYRYADIVKAAQDAGVPKFATGGVHLGGVRLVGEYGPEMEVTGPSRIYNAQQTQALLSGGASAEVVAAIKELKQQGYDIGRTLIVLLQSVEMLTRKQDAIGVLQRVPA